MLRVVDVFNAFSVDQEKPKKRGETKPGIRAEKVSGVWPREVLITFGENSDKHNDKFQ